MHSKWWEIFQKITRWFVIKFYKNWNAHLTVQTTRKKRKMDGSKCQNLLTHSQFVQHAVETSLSIERTLVKLVLMYHCLTSQIHLVAPSHDTLINWYSNLAQITSSSILCIFFVEKIQKFMKKKFHGFLFIECMFTLLRTIFIQFWMENKTFSYPLTFVYIFIQCWRVERSAFSRNSPRKMNCNGFCDF